MAANSISRAALGALAGLIASATMVSLSAAAPQQANTTRHANSTSITMQLSPFTPVKPKTGGTDNYHCSLLYPGNTTDQMITSTTFSPTTTQVHHVILYLGYPSDLTAAKALDNNGKGWTCFGAPQLTGSPSTISEVGRQPWLAASGPGHNTSYEPAGTGMPLPAGAFIIVQVHYNLLVGMKNGKSPVDKSTVTLATEPAATSTLKPLKIDTYVAPPDLPCPSGKKGPLCSRSKSLADLKTRFGQGEVNFVNLIEFICGRSNTIPADSANTVVSTSCTMPSQGGGYIQSVAPHMHMLGVSMVVTLNKGTADEQVLLNQTSYNFDLQRGTALVPPVQVKRSDRITVTCTYNPILRSLLPQTRSLPNRYITWGDGSSDEMCLAIIGRTTT
jgi:hypothetical protein